MSVTAPLSDGQAFPIPFLEVLARARKEQASSATEKIYQALLNHQDTHRWLEVMKPYAFVKGGVVKYLPSARGVWEHKARDVVIRTVFAYAKTVRSGEVTIPGKGKVFLHKEDMLDPAVQYGLIQGDTDLTAFAALHSLKGVGFTLDTARIQAETEYAERQKDWAHGEHPLQAIDGDLKALGIVADTPQEALEQLLLQPEPDPVLLGQLEKLLMGHQSNPVRDYGTFQATAWYTPDQMRGRTIQAKAIPTRVREALKGAVLITGNWESLNIPRQKRAEAFDRMVDLFEAAFKRQQPNVVAANTDDRVGKAAIMAAKRLDLDTVAVQLAGWDFKPARMQAQYCESMPKGRDVQYARDVQSVMLAELAACAMTLGDVDTALTHNFQRQGKVARSLTSAWVKHNGL